MSGESQDLMMAEREVIEIQANDLMADNVTREVHSDSRRRKILIVMALHQALQVVIVALNQAHQASLVTVTNFINLMNFVVNGGLVTNPQPSRTLSNSQSEEVNSYSEELFEDQLLEAIQLIPEGLMSELATNTSRIAAAIHKSTQVLKDMVSDMERLIDKL